MLESLFSFAAALGLAPQGAGAPAVLLNEAVVDDEGSDDREFAELVNASASPVDLGGWTIEVQDRRGLRASYAIATGASLAPCELYVLGTLTVPHVDQVLSGTNLFADASSAALVLKDAQGIERDRLVYHATFGLWPTAGGAGEGFWGESTSFDGFETSISRWRDGWNVDPARAWCLQHATPGEPNAQAWSEARREDFSGVPGTTVESWQGTRAPLVRVDPTQVGPLDPRGLPWNPSALPRDSSAAGGSGGACGLLWSPANGGGAALYRSDPVADLDVEGLFWLRSDALPLAQMETWSFGIQGSTDAYARISDPSGVIGFVRSGNTGVAWILQALDSGVILYLVDHGDGGWSPLARTPQVLLASVTIRAGVNDGWQRLRLAASGAQLVAELGGTLGVPGSGTAFRATPQHPAIGGIYLGYDRLVGAAAARPLCVDDLSIEHLGVPPLQPFGNAAATPSGTPVLFAPYCAAPGEERFELRLEGLAPGALAHFVLGARLQIPPLVLAVSGATLDVAPDVVCIFPASGAGVARLALPIACVPELRGTAAFAQGIVLDPTWSAPLPIGSSRALRCELR